jgi:hypothetical protein
VWFCAAALVLHRNAEEGRHREEQILRALRQAENGTTVKGNLPRAQGLSDTTLYI